MTVLHIPLFQVDAFTDRTFGGNPAAVCPLDHWLPKETMQAIAMENNVSETAFFVKEEGGYGLKWFSPEVEIDLCGHATLATAHVLYELLGYAEESIRFSSNSGILHVGRTKGLLTLDFPSRPLSKTEVTAKVSNALGAVPLEVLRNENTIMAVFGAQQEVEGMQPDFYDIKKLDSKIIYVTAPGDTVDFVSRVFAPAFGINEDPVTGSAHCSLVPYWSERLHKKVLTATQVSARRGALWCELSGDRVKMSGKAVTYLKGEISVTI